MAAGEDIEAHAVEEVGKVPPIAAMEVDDVPSLGSGCSDDGKLEGWDLAVVQFCLLFGLVLSVMDSSIVATALVEIGRYFDDFVRLQWVVLAYLLTYLGFSLIFSRMSDVLGRKKSTILALTILATMSLGCGLSRTLNQLIIFRALQGLGGSGIYAMTMTILPEITPVRKFPLMSALIGITFATSAVLGPVIGGVIVTHSSWRWCFLFNAPCAAFITVVALIFWPKTRTAASLTWRQLDLVGCVLCLAATVLLIFALQEAGSGVYSWSSATVVACLVVAGVSMVAFGLWIWTLSSKKRRIEPLVPGRIFGDRILVVDIIITGLIGYVFYTVLIELPQRLQILNGKSSQAAGIALLPLSGASALGSAIGGLASSKRNLTSYTMFAAGSFMLLGSALLRGVNFDRQLPAVLYGYEALLGLGVGLGFSAGTVIIKLNAHTEDAAPTQGLISQSRIFGGNIGLSVATLVLNRHFTTDLGGILSPSQIADLRKSLNVIGTFSPAQAEAVGVSVASSFRQQVDICVYLSAAAVVLSLLLWQRHPPYPAATRA